MVIDASGTGGDGSVVLLSRSKTDGSGGSDDSRNGKIKALVKAALTVVARQNDEGGGRGGGGYEHTMKAMTEWWWTGRRWDESHAGTSLTAVEGP